MKTNKVLIIHHDADYDGIFSNEVCRHFLCPSRDVVSQGWDYGKPVPQFNPADFDNVYMVDISVDELMDLAKVPNLIWIDHHKTAIEKFNPTIPGYRIDGVAACRLCWQWFQGLRLREHQFINKEEYVNRTVKEPLLIRLVGEHDIWDHRDERALILQFGLRELDEQEFRALVEVEFNNEDKDHALIDQCLSIGVRAKKSRDRANASIMAKRSHNVYWSGLTFLCCNGVSGSQAFQSAVRPNHDALMAWVFDGQTGKATVSMYHAPGHEHLDLSEIAKANGGGGHKGACGFQITLRDMEAIIIGELK